MANFIRRVFGQCLPIRPRIQLQRDDDEEEALLTPSIRNDAKCSPLVVPAGLPEPTAFVARGGPRPQRGPRRRALLVAVVNPRIEGLEELIGPWEDVELWTKLLTETYKYSMDDIVIMTDRPDVPGRLRPTRENLLREMQNFVKDALPTDQFVFTFSGHSDQQKTTEVPNLEEDDQDEVLLTCDGKRIVDNDLKAMLINPLPAGCFFTVRRDLPARRPVLTANPQAFLDSCHSGTMLDLPHYKCNQLYFPWVSRGYREQHTLRAAVSRRYAKLGDPLSRIIPVPAAVRNITDPPRRRQRMRLSVDTSFAAPAPAHVDSLPGMFSRVRRLRSLFGAEIQRCGSPTQDMCDGSCAPDVLQRAYLPTAVSFSACTDAQQAFEGGQTLTSIACAFLAKNPRASYRQLMSTIGYSLHENSMVLHKYTRSLDRKGRTDLEMVNFQTPVLSSLFKLNLDEPVHI
ncbi:hypothetical protein FA95DRAFT_121890 [Auriscalpium vulgare]|uniref:Uncharacterized protein n=1 Tax=Auriscalpium vulgare TaxID=40419 RepID=A0ACB8RNK1_9AGAM|nr:hypothetical protein FA95DRAFT_121890 [Auriscalpium vulgare]